MLLASWYVPLFDLAQVVLAMLETSGSYTS